MKVAFSHLFAVLFCAIMMAGCASFESTGPSGGFVRPTDPATLNTFSYDHTLVSGMVLNYSSQEMVMEELSQQVLTQGFQQRGYRLVEQQADFYVVSKWRKEINVSAAEPVRFSLYVELYDASNKTLFWSAQLPYIFTAIQWSEERVSQTLRLAIQNFPDRMTSGAE